MKCAIIPNSLVQLRLHVEYPPDYPDTIPVLSLSTIEGELTDEEESTLLSTLRNVANESIGMAQTFAIVSQLVDSIGSIVDQRVRRKQTEKEEKDRLESEAELKRIQGTPVTPDSFNQWRNKFNTRKRALKASQDEERMKGMSQKERDEYKKVASRLTGRQLFEQNKHLANSDASLLEEGAESVDISQYDRQEREVEEDKAEEHIHFSDSD
ncbi:hypothetical protein FRC02_000041 [Tulasnella sp. 418]|nr:hypothetical protein FRC02_000041 [Tulasnella sp. 418]